MVGCPASGPHPRRLRAGRVCQASDSPGFGPAAFPPLVIWAPICCFRDAGRNVLETSRGGSFLKPPPVPLPPPPPTPPASSGDQARSIAAWHTWQTHRQVERLPGLPTRGRGAGKELGAIPGWAKGGTRAVSGCGGEIHHPLHALSLCSLQPKAMSLTHSCLSPCFPKCKRQVKLLLPLPVPSGQVCRWLAPLGPVFRAGLSEPVGGYWPS